MKCNRPIFNKFKLVSLNLALKMPKSTFVEILLLATISSQLNAITGPVATRKSTVDNFRELSLNTLGKGFLITYTHYCSI
jgi:hypothetical protein